MAEHWGNTDMDAKRAHEPEAQVMSAVEVKEDARRIARVIRQNLEKIEPVVRLQVPLSALLSALDDLNRDELLLLQKRVEERLAI